MKKCDGCGQRFTVEHALSCKVGGQVLARHNDLKEEWAGLCGHAFGRSNVYDEPLIKSSRDVREAGETDNAAPLGEDRGDVAVHNFWRKRQGAVFDVCVTDTDAPYQQGTEPHSCLVNHKKRKKRHYLEPCLERHRSFTPLVFSVDGLMGTEGVAAMRRLAATLAIKWHAQYSSTVGYVRARLSLALVRATSRCL